MSDEEAILDESKANLREANQMIRANRNRLWSAGMDEHPNYQDLAHRVMTALAMTEAAFVEARRRLEQEQLMRDTPPHLKAIEE